MVATPLSRAGLFDGNASVRTHPPFSALTVGSKAFENCAVAVTASSGPPLVMPDMRTCGYCMLPPPSNDAGLFIAQSTKTLPPTLFANTTLVRRNWFGWLIAMPAANAPALLFAIVVLTIEIGALLVNAIAP